MSVEERERLLFSFGWECLEDAKTEVSNATDEKLWLRQTDIFPHCAMLHVLAMIEEMDGSINFIYPAPYRFNFYLSAIDDNNTFRDLVNKIPLFYPWVTIGEVILRSDPAAPREKKPSEGSAKKGQETPNKKDGQRDAKAENVRKIEGVRIAFLIIAVILWIPALVGILILPSALDVGLGFIAICGPMGALFLWLCLTKRKIQGLRIVFLIIATIFGMCALLGLSLLRSEPDVGLGLTVGYGPLCALFFWLCLRKKKPQAQSPRLEESQLQLSHQQEPQPQKNERVILGRKQYSLDSINLIFFPAMSYIKFFATRDSIRLAIR